MEISLILIGYLLFAELVMIGINNNCKICFLTGANTVSPNRLYNKAIGSQKILMLK